MNIIALVVAIFGLVVGYRQTRSFVRRRLRFVGAAQSFFAPFFAGFGAMLLIAPLVWILPVIGGGTALLFGLGVGAGVAAGAKDIRSHRFLTE